MSDPYAEQLAVAIDRDRLKNYLRFKWLLAWLVPLCFFGGLLGLASISKSIDEGIVTGQNAMVLISIRIGTGVGIGLLLAACCYLMVSHRAASRLAATLNVSVEGSFLRIQQHASVFYDRKLHFRSIVDYTTTQDRLMRWFGIHSLQMSTTAGGHHAVLFIHGVKDCLRIRDLLADIDRIRENA